MESSGVRIEGKAEYVAGTLRPLRDQIIVKPLEWQPSKVIHVTWAKRTLRGEIVAAGPGCFPWKYNADRSKRWPSKVFRPTQVKVGDTVELGGLEQDGYSFPRVLIDGQPHLICREEDVCGVVN